MLYIGIDLWTSACKLLLVTEDGSILNTVTKEYPLIFPHPSWSEQKPEDWWDAVVTGVPELLHGFDANEVAGIGTGGQMHGLVALDAQNNIIRPAILWNDGRTSKEVDYLNNVVGKDKLSALTANIAFAGFTAPKLLWMRENEPENFRKIAKIMLPKDYLTYKLTGVHACDYSDASGMLLLDVQHKCWSQEMLDICGIHKSQMPKLYESFEVVGQLTKEAAQTLGLPETVKVVAGAGRQCRGGGRHRHGRRGRLQHQLGHVRHDLHLVRQIRRRPQQRPARLCPRRRRLSPDGLHALCRELQQVAVRGNSEDLRFRERTGGYHRRKARRKPRLFPAVSHGRAQPHQRHQRPRHVHRHDDGHEPL